MKNLYKNILLPAGLLAGTVIGAGMFALPFLFTKAGFGVGAAALLLGSGAYLLIHLAYADLIVRSPGEHRFAGYAKLYLGRVGFWVAAIVAVFEMVTVLTIYLVISVSFANLLFPGDSIVKLLAFWALASLAMFLPLKRLALTEFLLTGGKVAIILGILAFGIPNASRILDVGLFTEWQTVLLPLGPALFALSGRVAIPSVVAYFREKGVVHSRKALASAITAGTLIPAIVYILFVIAITSLSQSVSDDSVTGLIGSIPPLALMGMGVLGLMSIWSAYVLVGVDTKNLLHYDFKFFPAVAAVATIAAPLLLYFAGFHNFIELVSFVGGIFLAIEGLLVLAMWWSSKRYAPHHPPLLSSISPLATGAVALVFVVVALHEIFKYTSTHWIR